MEVRGLQWPSMWMDLFWCKCACCHYLSLAISRLLPEDGYCYCYWVEDNHNVLMKTSLLSNTCFSLTLSFCYSWHAILTEVMPMLLMLMVVLSEHCSQQWFQSERTGPSLHSWGIPAMNITCQSACISYPNRDNYADQMTMITWTIWFDQFMSPEQIFESSWTSFMPCITFKSTPTDLTPVTIILNQIFQSAPCEDGGAAAALRRSPRYCRHPGRHQCSSDSAKLSTTLSSWWKCDRINVHWSSLSCHPKESFPRKCSVSSWTGVSDIYQDMLVIFFSSI